MSERLRAAVVTVSDGVTHGTRKDESGDLTEALLRGAGFEIADRVVVPDERPMIEDVLRRLVEDDVGLIVTTGGTGFGPRDVTPEATRAVIDREAPGIAELMRQRGLEETPLAALSRSVVGSRGATLIVNLPGSPKGVRESLGAAMSVVPHAVELLTGTAGVHPTGHPAAVDGDRTGLPEPDEPPGPGPTAEPVAGPSPLAAWVDVKAVRVHGSPPCGVGAWMRIVPGGEVRGTLGCAEFDEAAVRDAALVIGGEPQLRTYHHELGDIEVYLEAHRGGPTLVVVSATDVARNLVRLGRQLGFEPVLLETRAERVTDEDRAGAPVRHAWAAIELDERARVVFTDHDVPGIAEQLAHVLRSRARFVGVMGSRRHVGPYMEELRSMGFDDEDLARLRSPLGLDLGGRRPDEIALSIAAGLVADANARDGGWLDQ